MIQFKQFNESYAGFDQAVINEILNMFLEDYQGVLKSIGSAIESENSVQLMQLVHKYKGTVSAMFDEDLRQEVAHLEVLAKQLNFEHSKAQFKIVVDGSQRLADELKKMIK